MVHVVNLEEEKERSIWMQEFERAWNLRDESRSARREIDRKLKEMDEKPENELARALTEAFLGPMGCRSDVGDTIDRLPKQAELIHAAGDIAYLKGHPVQAKALWNRVAELDPTLKPRVV